MDERFATYSLHFRHDNMKQCGMVTLDPVDRPVLYGTKIDFDNPQKEISDGTSIVAKLSHRH